jgi:GTPase SAR1 family protein
MDTVADERRFHPVRDWLRELEHDGTTRIDKWLIHVLGMDPAKLKPKRKRYLEMVGRFLLIGMVARVMKPGCKFDYSPVLEGLPGVGKSTFVKTLVGEEFFSDTHFDIGNGKDGFEQLEGLWGYELSELTALRKADSEQVKQFFSSTIDRFRGAYGRFVQAHPRQCVIFCSTNKKVYLYDLTGNRRFWPIWIEQRIKLEWLRKYRALLFAEAMALYRQGERYAPTPEEEIEFFEPEQRLRLVETAVQSRLYELLTREGAPGTEGKATVGLNQLTAFVTLDSLVVALGADPAKSSSLLESQIRGWLEAHGWEHGREGGGARRRGYKQPAVWPPRILDDEEPAQAAGEDEAPGAGGNNEVDDDTPF